MTGVQAGSLVRGLLVAVLLALPVHAAGQTPCALRDFLTLPLPAAGDPVRTALEIAYPGSRVDGASFIASDGTAIPFALARDMSPAARLDGATIGDMFVYPYPLAFDLVARQTPWADPGRVRNEALFHALYAQTEGEARSSLVTVTYQGQTIHTSFNVTTDNCVDVQLTAALTAIATLSPGIDPVLDQSGGSFNWRVIAGTNRLSSHSFGAAVDLNTELGGYWRWSGRPEGDAGPYDNRIPPEVVAAFERYGFVWGGKWHHFDGMHFEYRPELILHARLTGG